MRQPVLCFLFLAVSAGCGSVSKGDADADSGSGPGDHRSDGGGDGEVIADAGTPDATPVACTTPEDCASPDDPCLLPGTCTNDVCHFPQKDCSDLDGECTRGVCADDGECQARPIREDMACGDGIMDCGAYGACGGFADICAESGTQSRSCTDWTCQSGTCASGAAYENNRSCERDTDGDSCGSTAVSCDACGYTTECDNSAPDAECRQFSQECSAGTCQTFETPLPDDECERNTQGEPCGAQGAGCCTAAGACSFCT